MAPAATTIRVFGGYLFVIAAAMMLVPNQFLAIAGMPAVDDVWIRVVGMLAGILGYYYVRAAAAGLNAFFAWTVHARLGVLVVFAAFVGFGLAPPMLVAFGVIDAAAALWTWSALRAAGPATA
jgi:hypothetical protein